MVDLSSELEKDHQIEQMGTRIREPEEQMEVQDNTIDVLENQVHYLLIQLDEANAHMEMHHQEMQ